MILSPTPLIAGAGPVGLGAALFLRQAGIATRVIDMAEAPSSHSRALAVNPRTLELLESTGVTNRMLSIGLKVRGARFEFPSKWSGELPLSSIRHKYPFMLALSQGTTEHLLTEALESAGGHVERGTTLVSCLKKGDEGVEVELKHASGTIETLECPWMLSADGAHSAARKSLGIEFAGSSLSRAWHLADMPLKTTLENDFAHVFFFPDGGFMFLLRVVSEESPASQEPGLWRVITDRQELLQRVPKSTPAGEPEWSSDFHISHRINDQLQAGNVYFAGDAAHIHSPMGARGMNLGLEDAYVFSRLVEMGEMGRYGELRKRVDGAVVKRIEFLSKIVLGESWSARLERVLMMKWLVKLPSIRGKFMEAMTGLDHPLEVGPTEAEKRDASDQQAPEKVAQHAH